MTPSTHHVIPSTHCAQLYPSVLSCTHVHVYTAAHLGKQNAWLSPRACGITQWSVSRATLALSLCKLHTGHRTQREPSPQDGTCLGFS